MIVGRYCVGSRSQRKRLLLVGVFLLGLFPVSFVPLPAQHWIALRRNRRWNYPIYRIRHNSPASFLQPEKRRSFFLLPSDSHPRFQFQSQTGTAFFEPWVLRPSALRFTLAGSLGFIPRDTRSRATAWPKI